MTWGGKAALLAFTFLGIGSVVYLLFRRKEIDETDEGYTNFVKSRSKVIEVKVPKESIAMIIGRGGSKVKNLEEITDTKIHFRDARGSDHRLCVIRGSEEGVLMAEHLIHDIIVNQPLIETCEIYVPKEACGRIVGKNGENIMGICQSSNAKIVLEGAPHSKDKSQQKITIKGTKEQIEYAKLLIEEKIEEENTFRNLLQTSMANRSPRHKAKYLVAGSEELEAKEARTQKETLIATGSDGMLEVYVSAVSDPEKFWVQMMGPSTVALDRLNDQMTEYYTKKENRDLHILKEVAVHQIVAAPFWNDKKWYRAEVADIKADEYDADESEIILYYVDYGDSAVCKKKDIYELKTHFLRLRFQAIECTLAKIKSRETWPEEAIDHFEVLTHAGLWHSVTARVQGLRERPTRAKQDGSLVPCIELYDAQETHTVNVAEEMVKMGYAEWDEEKPSAGGSPKK